MSNIILIIALVVYTIQVKNLRKRVTDLEEVLKCSMDDFWSEEDCEEKI